MAEGADRDDETDSNDAGATNGDEGVPPSEEESAAEGEPATAEDGGTLARVRTAIAWVAGIALIGVGLLGMTGGGPGIGPLVLGLFVTPRTRRELQELCRLLCAE